MCVYSVIMRYRKIRIVGASGAGKTYLATKLSESLGVPRTSLDEVAYDFSTTHKFIHKRTEVERNKIYRSVLRRKRWIIDGTWYWAWSKDSCEQADIIIYLHNHIFFCTFNVFKRFFQRWCQGKYEGLPQIYELLKYNFGDGRKKAKERLLLFQELFGEKVVVCSSADKAYEWLMKEL
jgi:adenylate kinase family enzyme